MFRTYKYLLRPNRRRMNKWIIRSGSALDLQCRTGTTESQPIGRQAESLAFLNNRISSGLFDTLIRIHQGY